MTALESVLAGDPDRERAVRDALDELASKSPVAAQAVRNIWKDTRVNDATWESLIQTLCAQPKNADAIAQACSAAFARDILQAQEIHIPSCAVFARAVRWDVFVRFLRDLPELAMLTDAEASHRLQRVLSRGVSEVLAELGDIPLGRWLCWSTFDAFGNRPLQAFSESTLALQANLGLDSSYPHKAVVTFEYRLPSNAKARFPTVAEAYAGAAWNYYFCPAHSHEECGFTLPWPDIGGAKRRREVVHELPRVSDLVHPIGLVT